MRKSEEIIDSNAESPLDRIIGQSLAQGRSIEYDHIIVSPQQLTRLFAAAGAGDAGLLRDAMCEFELDYCADHLPRVLGLSILNGCLSQGMTVWRSQRQAPYARRVGALGLTADLTRSLTPPRSGNPVEVPCDDTASMVSRQFSQSWQSERRIWNFFPDQIQALDIAKKEIEASVVRGELSSILSPIALSVRMYRCALTVLGQDVLSLTSGTLGELIPIRTFSDFYSEAGLRQARMDPSV